MPENNETKKIFKGTHRRGLVILRTDGVVEKLEGIPWEKIFPTTKITKKILQNIKGGD
jgi:hypothetical protein